MSKTCVKCGYIRQATDRAPDYECPKCGVIYAKAEAVQHPPEAVTTTEQIPEISNPKPSRALILLQMAIGFGLAIFFLPRNSPFLSWLV